MIATRAAVLAVATAALASVAGAQDMSRLAVPSRTAELIDQLKNADPEKRMEAAAALGVLGPAAKPAIPNLVEALKDPVAAVRMKAIDALMLMGPAAAEAASKIPPFLNDPDELVRVSAVVALPRITAEPSSTVPLLKKALGDNASTVRRSAAIELAMLQAELPAAVPVLREGLDDPIPSRRLEVCIALGKVVPAQERKAIAAIAAAFLQDRNIRTRVEAARALGWLGAEAVPYLVRILESADRERPIYRMAIRSLGRIGPDAKASLPVLRALTENKRFRRGTLDVAIAAIEGKEPPPPPSPPARPR